MTKDEIIRRYLAKLPRYALIGGQAARDAAIATVLANENYGELTTIGAFVDHLPEGTELTGEDIRLGCTAVGITVHHPNVWGGVTLNLVQAGLLVDTGRRTRMKDKSSHARGTAIYRKVGEP